MRIKMFLPNSFQLFSHRVNKRWFLLVSLSANFIWYKWYDIHCKTCTTLCCKEIYYIFPTETHGICSRAVKTHFFFNCISFFVWLPTADALLEHDSLPCFTWKNTRNEVLTACSDTLLFYRKMADIVHKFSVTYSKLQLLGQYVYDVPYCPYWHEPDKKWSHCTIICYCIHGMQLVHHFSSFKTMWLGKKNLKKIKFDQA